MRKARTVAGGLNGHGPGAYAFGDYWKIGVLIVSWSMAVVVFIAPLYWRF
ncbi:MAG TPA: hypothetical protein VJU59_25780 [Paraburkholderia sp.]|jgi:di/tricarboxylate transporter|nr:hypothetical protein [Paraburkholderia sp.]HKR43047.1 hypothetical protein [Paraburkholderia sp.]